MVFDFVRLVGMSNLSLIVRCVVVLIDFMMQSMLLCSSDGVVL